MKTIWLLALLCALFATARGQQGFVAGPVLAAQLTSLRTDSTGHGVTGGIAAGGFFGVFISERFAANLGAVYSMQGSSRVRVHSLNIPLSVELLAMSSDHRVRPKLLLGLQPGFTLAANTPETFTFEVAPLAGLGANIRLSEKMILSTDLRGWLGLMQLDAVADYRQWGVALHAALGFQLGKK